MEGPVYLNMHAKVTIGKIYFDAIDAIVINQSVNDLSDTATITLPRFYKQLDGKYPLDYMQPGDKVLCEFGYDETGMQLEFEGYVRSISADVPLEIHCDQLYPLRQNNFVKSFRQVTLKQLLTDVTKGTFITSLECPDVQLGKFIVDNASTYQVMEKVKEQFGLLAKVRGTVLQVGWAWDWKPGYTQKHTYHIQANVKSNRLEYRTKDGYNVRIRVKIRENNKETYVEVGSKDSDAAVTTIDYAANSQKVAKQIADSRYKMAVYEGYTGAISGFGIPLTKAGDSLIIQDDREPYREGTYLIDRVTISYDQNTGINRENNLAFKL